MWGMRAVNLGLLAFFLYNISCTKSEIINNRIPYSEIVIDNSFYEVDSEAKVTIEKDREGGVTILDRMIEIVTPVNTEVWGGPSYEDPALNPKNQNAQNSQIPRFAMVPGTYFINVAVYRGETVRGSSRFCEKSERMKNIVKIFPGRNYVLIQICDSAGKLF